MILNAFKTLGLGIIIASFTTIGLAHAGDKTYTEGEFIKSVGNKTKKSVLAELGKPAKTQLPVKPVNAEKITGKDLDDKKSKKIKIEMWYYHHLVKYDATHTYKEAELTFVNGRVANIAFFNNR